MLDTYIRTFEAVVAELDHSTDKVRALTNILNHVLTVSQAEIGALLVIGDDIDNLTMVTRQGMPDEIIKQLKTGELGRRLKSGQPLWLTPKPLQLDVEQALLKRHKLKFLCGVPLLFNNRVLGAIIVSTKSATVPPRTELEPRLNTLARLLALFLDDVQLRSWYQTLAQGPEETPEQSAASTKMEEAAELEELLAAVMSAEEEVVQQNTDLGVLNTLASEVQSSLKLETILDVTLNHTVTALEADAGWCYLIENGDLVLQGQCGLSTEFVNRMQYLKAGNGAEGMAFSKGQPIFADGLLYHSGKMRQWVKEEKLFAVGAVPLRVQGNIIGVLAVARHEIGDWSTRDERMLVSISQKMAQAIANAQHVNQVETQASTWQNNYQNLKQVNDELIKRTQQLEEQVNALRQADQQIWVMLAASKEAGYRADSQDQLVHTLKKALGELRAA